MARSPFKKRSARLPAVLLPGLLLPGLVVLPGLVRLGAHLRRRATVFVREIRLGHAAVVLCDQALLVGRETAQLLGCYVPTALHVLQGFEVLGRQLFERPAILVCEVAA